MKGRRLQTERVTDRIAQDVLQNRAVPESFVRRYAFEPGNAIGCNEVAIVLKPEAFGRSATAIDRMLRHVVGFLRAESVSILDAAVCTGSWLSQNRGMAVMYPILHYVCSSGIAGLSETALHRLQQITDTRNVFAAHEVMANGTSVEQLERLVRSGETAKLGTGTYLTELKLDGRSAFVINGFHPQQEQHFYNAPGSIVVFRCKLEGSISELKALFGDIDPEHAAEATLRRQLLELTQDFEIDPPSIARNCAHLSPSALDAMFLLAELFVDGATPHVRYARTSIGERLSREFCDNQDLSRLPLLQVRCETGLRNWILEETEWKDAEEILSIFENRNEEIAICLSA